MKRKTKNPLKIAREKALTEFQRYARLRDADDNGYCLCIACGDKKRWDEGDGGHFIGRKWEATAFEEANVNFECKRCNGFLNGNLAFYSEGLIKKWGIEEFDKIHSMKWKVVQRSVDDYKDLAKAFKNSAERMKKEKNL